MIIKGYCLCDALFSMIYIIICNYYGESEEFIMNQKKKQETKSAGLLMLTSIIWGVAFVFQRTGMDHIGPFAFNFFRCIICLAFLFIINRIAGKRRKKLVEQGYYEEVEGNKGFKDKSLIIGGLLAGLALFLAMSTQQVGMVSTTASKAGFITTMYIVMVPVMGIFYGRKTNLKMWICVALAAVGLYLLSIKEGFVIERGDFLVFLSAICFGLQIIVIDLFAPKADALKLSMVQFITSGTLSLIAMLGLENLTLLGLQAAAVAILYTGLLSSGVGFTLQIVAQKNLSPTISSLIMSMESGVSVVAGVLLLGETLTSREIAGCIIMVIAVLAAQIQLPKKIERTAVVETKKIKAVEIK